MAFRLAELFVEIGAKTGGVNAVLAGLHARLLGMGAPGQAASGIVHSLTMQFSALHGAIGSVGIMAGVALAGSLVVGLAHCAMEAAHLQEAVAKTEQAFGSATPKVLAMADELQHKFGALKKEILDTAASFGLMLQGAGVTREISAGMSVELSKIAVDAASFFDVSMNEAITRLQSGLSGEMEAVRRWGINLSETNVKRQGAAMGFGSGELSQEAKTLIRYKLILEGLSAAAGDAERSQYRLVGQWKLFTGNLYETATLIGAFVAPAFNLLLIVTNAVLGAFNRMLQGILLKVTATVQFLGSLFGLDIMGMGDTEKRRAEIDKRIEGTEKDREADKELAKLGTEKDPKGWMGGVGENWKHVQEAIFAKGKDSVAKDTLKETEAMRKLLAEIKAKMDKGDKLEKLGP